MIVINSYSVARPLNRVSEQIIRINNLDLKTFLNENSDIIEIFQLQKALNTMQKTLTSFSHYIPKKVVKLLIKENKEAVIDG